MLRSLGVNEATIKRTTEDENQQKALARVRAFARAMAAASAKGQAGACRYCNLEFTGSRNPESVHKGVCADCDCVQTKFLMRCKGYAVLSYSPIHGQMLTVRLGQPLHGRSRPKRGRWFYNFG